MAELRDLLDHDFTLFVFSGNGFLTAIGRVRNQDSERVDTGLEGREIDRRVREIRISCQPLVHIDELLDQIGIRRSESEQCF